MIVEKLERKGVQFRLHAGKLEMRGATEELKELIKEYSAEIEMELLKREATRLFDQANDTSTPYADRLGAHGKFERIVAEIGRRSAWEN